MGVYNSHFTRDTVTFDDQKLVNEIIDGVTQGSTILPLMNKLPNMSSKTARIAVMSALPDAYWVEGDEGLKQTTTAAWKNKYIYAEELAVVVPVAQSILDDSEYDIFAEIKPKIIEQFYKKIDQAILLGVGKPTSWRAGLLPSIVASDNKVTATTNLYNDISDAMTKVELDGYDVTGVIGGVAAKGEFRKGLIDKNGQPIQGTGVAGEVTSLPRQFAKNGAWDDSQAKLIVGDFKQAVYAIRRDIEFKVFDTGVVTDNSGNIIYNLLQQDMVALRVTMRLGWELPNPVNVLNSDATETNRLPFAAIVPAA